MCAQGLEQGQAWQAEHGVVGAVDGGEKLGAAAFQTIGADAVEECGAFRCQIIVEEMFGEGAHGHAGRFEMGPQWRRASEEDDRGMKGMRAVAQCEQLPPGMREVCRLAVDLSVA